MAIIHTPATLAERKAKAEYEVEGALGVLKMMGVPRINVDVPTLLGDIRALRALLVRAGLVSVEEYEAIAAEETAAFLRDVIGKFQSASRLRPNVGGDS